MTQYALEWNQSHNKLFVQPLERSLADAQTHFLDDRRAGYSIIMVGEKEAILAMAESWSERLTERGRALARTRN